jgi:hypothetical protein
VIVNDVRALRNRESSDTVYIASAFALALTFADGTPAAPSVAVDNGSLAFYHDFTSDDVTMSVLGKLLAIWEFTVSGQIVHRVETYFISKFDIIGWVRQELRANVVSLPDVDIDNLLVQLVDDLEESYPTCFPYRSLTGQDQYWCDRGLSYTVAACLLAENPARWRNGPVSSIQDAQIRYQFAIQPTLSGALTLAERLLARGWTELQRISCLKTVEKISPLFALAGARRGAQEHMSDDTGYEFFPLMKSLVIRRAII